MFSSLFKTKKGKLTFWISLSAVALIIIGSLYFIFARADFGIGVGPIQIKIPTIFAGDAAIYGTVTDAASTTALSDVKVTITQQMMSITVATNQTGVYRIDGLKQGTTFALKFEKSGYSTETRTATTNKVWDPIGIGAGSPKGKVVDVPMTPAMSIVLTSDVATQPVQTGQSANLNWEVKNYNATTACTGSGAWSGQKSLDTNGKGTQKITFNTPGNFVYVLTCTKDGQSYSFQNSQVAITVTQGSTAGLAPLYGNITYRGKPYTVAGQVVKVVSVVTGQTYAGTPEGGVYSVKVPTGTYGVKIFLNVNNVNKAAWVDTITVTAAGLKKDLSF